jgi:hypothetical protein
MDRTPLLTLCVLPILLAGTCGLAQAEVFSNPDMASHSTQVFTSGSEFTLTGSHFQSNSSPDLNYSDLGGFFSRFTSGLSEDCYHGDSPDSGHNNNWSCDRNWNNDHHDGGECPSPSSVPEPSSIVTVCLGGLLSGVASRRKARA